MAFAAVHGDLDLGGRVPVGPHRLQRRALLVGMLRGPNRDGLLRPGLREGMSGLSELRLCAGLADLTEARCNRRPDNGFTVGPWTDERPYHVPLTEKPERRRRAWPEDGQLTAGHTSRPRSGRRRSNRWHFGAGMSTNVHWRWPSPRPRLPACL